MNSKFSFLETNFDINMSFCGRKQNTFIFIFSVAQRGVLGGCSPPWEKISKGGAR
jgi:hypothetical protein